MRVRKRKRVVIRPSEFEGGHYVESPRGLHWRTDIYSVGWLKALQVSWRMLRGRDRRRPAVGRSRWWYPLRVQWAYCVVQVRRRNWRAVRNSLNGYLAEPREFPLGDYVRRCGVGWTKRRALRSLARRLP